MLWKHPKLSRWLDFELRSIEPQVLGQLVTPSRRQGLTRAQILQPPNPALSSGETAVSNPRFAHRFKGQQGATECI